MSGVKCYTCGMSVFCQVLCESQRHVWPVRNPLGNPTTCCFACVMCFVKLGSMSGLRSVLWETQGHVWLAQCPLGNPGTCLACVMSFGKPSDTSSLCGVLCETQQHVWLAQSHLENSVACLACDVFPEKLRDKSSPCVVFGKPSDMFGLCDGFCETHQHVWLAQCPLRNSAICMACCNPQCYTNTLS